MRRAIALLSSSAVPYAFRVMIIATVVVLAPPALARAQAEDMMEITVGGGPHAGTYKAPTGVLICMRMKSSKRLVATFRDFDAHDPKALSEGAITVDNPDQPSAKIGEVRVAFGDPDKSPVIYDLHIPADSKGPITLTTGAKGGAFAFDGRTKDGIVLRLTAKCAEFEAMP